MKKLFLFVALIAATTLTFGQKSKVTYSVGAVALYSITSSVDTKVPSFGETAMINCQPTDKVGYTLSATYLQNKNRFVQVPVLAGVRFNLLKNLSFGAEAGVSFYNTDETKFTYSPSLSLQLGKVSVTQKFLSSVNGGKSASSVGLGVSYNFN